MDHKPNFSTVVLTVLIISIAVVNKWKIDELKAYIENSEAADHKSRNRRALKDTLPREGLTLSIPPTVAPKFVEDLWKQEMPILKDLHTPHNKFTYSISTLLQNPDLQQYIQNEVNKTIQLFLSSLPLITLCKNKCDRDRKVDGKKNQSQNYLKGPPGPAGPQGPPGPPGPSCRIGSQGENGSQCKIGLQGPKDMVLYAPEIRNTSLNATVNITNDEVFSCTVYGNPIPHVEWNHNGKVTTGETVVNHKKAFIKSIFRLKNVTWEDRGNVSCTAKTILGEASSTGFVNVYIPPKLKCPRPLIYAYVGSDYVFPQCNITSNPKPTTTWRRGYGPMPERRFVTSGDTLEIKDFRISDEGFYIMEISNFLGSQRVIFQVRTRRLSFVTKPAPFTTIVHNRKILICAAEGNSKKVSGKWIDFHTREEIIFKTKVSGNKITVGARVDKQGTYECQFTDGIDTISAAVFVQKSFIDSNLLTKEEKYILVNQLKKYGIAADFKMCYSAIHGQMYLKDKLKNQTELLVVGIGEPLDNNTLGFYQNIRQNQNMSFIFTFHEGGLFFNSVDASRPTYCVTTYDGDCNARIIFKPRYSFTPSEWTYKVLFSYHKVSKLEILKRQCE